MKGKDEVSSPPRKKNNLAQKGLVSCAGKEAAGKGPGGGREVLGWCPQPSCFRTGSVCLGQPGWRQVQALPGCPEP